jgi:hypothetical protein
VTTQTATLTPLERVVVAGRGVAYAVNTYGINSVQALTVMAVASVVTEEAHALGYTADDFNAAHAAYTHTT